MIGDRVRPHAVPKVVVRQAQSWFEVGFTSPKGKWFLLSRWEAQVAAENAVRDFNKFAGID